MSYEKSSELLQPYEVVTQLRLEALMQELTKRVRVVSDDALQLE